MEIKKTVPHIKLTIISGGMFAFSETGILPRFLLFNSTTLRRSWRLKLKEDTQNGVLNVNGQVAFYYFFDGLGFKIQSLKDGTITEEWEIEEILMELRD